MFQSIINSNIVDLREKRLWKSQVHHWPLYNDGTEKMRKSGLTLSRRGELSVWELIISCHCETDKNINSRMDDTLIHCGHRLRFVFFEAQWDIIVGRLERRERRRSRQAASRGDRGAAATLRDNTGMREREHLWLSRGSVLQISWGLSFYSTFNIDNGKEIFP